MNDKTTQLIEQSIKHTLEIWDKVVEEEYEKLVVKKVVKELEDVLNNDIASDKYVAANDAIKLIRYFESKNKQ